VIVDAAGDPSTPVQVLDPNDESSITWFVPLRAQVHRERLTAFKLGRDWLVEEEEVDRYRRESLRPRAAGLGLPSDATP
jgi:hypothetical protein